MSEQKRQQDKQSELYKIKMTPELRIPKINLAITGVTHLHLVTVWQMPKTKEILCHLILDIFVTRVIRKIPNVMRM